MASSGTSLSIRYSLFSIRYSLFATPYSLSTQIHFHHALVGRHLVDGAFRQHRALMQAGHPDAEVAHESHVMLDHDDGLGPVDFLEQLGGLPCLGVGHAGPRFI